VGAASRDYAERLAPFSMRAFSKPSVERLKVDESAAVL
jgi:hypothetical protein